jgi:hypothetical protein
MASNNGYNTESLIDPIEFYNIITNNLNKFSDEEQFTILRFFDKLTDSIGFTSLCKSRMRYHIHKKDIKLKANEIFNSSMGCSKVEILKGIAYLIRGNDNSWEFKLGDRIILDGLSNEDALKIVKDVNNAFLIKNDRKR